MISKAQKKRIISLRQKKFRRQYGRFLVEGYKSIPEFIQEGWELEVIYTRTPLVFKGITPEKVVEITEADSKQISALSTPSESVGVFYTKNSVECIPDSGLSVLMDDVQDPGNLGTIIRLCDWFGVTQLICSQGSADCFNPKVVQASMGSLARVPVSYVNLDYFLKQLPETARVYGTFMEGEPIQNVRVEKETSNFLILGNEGHGISDYIRPYIHTSVTIPRKRTGDKPESLNVATATAVLLYAFTSNT